MKSIVVFTDGSDCSMCAVREAAELARDTGATLHIACVVNLAKDVAAASLGSFVVPEGFDDQARAAGQGAIDRATEVANKYTQNVQGHVLQGDIAASLMALCEHVTADVLVVGSKGMTGAARFLLGSVPNRCAHHAPCSVLIARTV